MILIAQSFAILMLMVLIMYVVGVLSAAKRQPEQRSRPGPAEAISPDAMCRRPTLIQQVWHEDQKTKSRKRLYAHSLEDHTIRTALQISVACGNMTADEAERILALRC